MRRIFLCAALVAAIVGGPGVPAVADVSPTQVLPSESCNGGTMNAHESIPETTGTGTVTPGHEAVPESESATPCEHGG